MPRVQGIGELDWYAPERDGPRFYISTSSEIHLWLTIFGEPAAINKAYGVGQTVLQLILRLDEPTDEREWSASYSHNGSPYYCRGTIEEALGELTENEPLESEKLRGYIKPRELGISESLDRMLQELACYVGDIISAEYKDGRIRLVNIIIKNEPISDPSRFLDSLAQRMSKWAAGR